MKNNIYPKNYQSVLDLVDTQKAIKLVKDTFESELAKGLNLIRVSAPLFVEPKTGLNAGAPRDPCTGPKVRTRQTCSGHAYQGANPSQ